MPIFIRPGELLVGQRADILAGRSVYPEFQLDGLTAETAPSDVWDYWHGQTLGDLARGAHPERLRIAERERAAGSVTGTASGFGHVIVDYEKALRRGFRDIIREAQAATEADPQRRQELECIARTCRWVPAEPARDFREALQSFWFVHLAMHIEQYGWSISAGRFDQYVYPFYRHDLDAGALTREEAWELLQS